MRGRKKWSWGVICIASFVMVLLAYFPHFQSEMQQGHDDWFHLHRIYALASELRQGIFPVKIHHLAGYGYGYGVGFFYSNFLTAGLFLQARCYLLLLTSTQNFVYHILKRNFTTHQTYTVFFCLLSNIKALHTRRSQGAAQRFIFTFTHDSTSVQKT